MTCSGKSFTSTRTVSRRHDVPRWFVLLLLVMILLSVGGMAAVLFAADVTLSWQANTELDLAGYKVYQSTVSGQYGAAVSTVGSVTTQTLTLPQLDVDTTYFFVITAYDLAGNESEQSLEVSKMVAGIPTGTSESVRFTGPLLITYQGVMIENSGTADGFVSAYEW